MTATVVKLPTAAPAYIQLRRDGEWWIVEAVTPRPGEQITTFLIRTRVRDLARDYAKSCGFWLQRPVRLPRGFRKIPSYSSPPPPRTLCPLRELVHWTGEQSDNSNAGSTPLPQPSAWR